MSASLLSSGFRKQHLIDPEICIRCNTCEATCPVGAVTHDDVNYVVDAEKCNVQDRMRATPGPIAPLLRREMGHIFICGLKGMETGVDEALDEICRKNGLDWGVLKPQMRASGRYQVETY